MKKAPLYIGDYQTRTMLKESSLVAAVSVKPGLPERS